MANLPLSISCSHKGREDTAPLIHNLTTRWWQVVNFIHQPLYDWAEKPLLPTEQEWCDTAREPTIVCLCQD